MSAWAPKRFWKEAVAEHCDGGFTVRLDGRPVRTPAKTLLVLPTLAMAQAVAAEWDAQEGVLRPETMPATRAANSAIDKVAPQMDAVVEEVARYGGSELLCYRAEAPAELVARQEAGWGPWLDWATQSLGAPLRVTQGVIHMDQPPESLARLKAEVARATPFELAALHDLVAITGSLVLGLATARGRLPPDAAFDLSRIDEHWQAEQWGEDEEAAVLEAAKRQALRDAGRFYGLCG